MLPVNNMNIWLMMMTIGQVSAMSYNRPKFYSNASWNPTAITFANSTTVGSQPFDLFINTNNTIYVANRQNGQLLQWSNGSTTLTRNISGLNLPRSLFVTESGEIYADNSVSYGEIDKWTLNSNSAIPIMYTCSSCYDIFIDISNTLYCSMDGSHQVVSKSLNHSSNEFQIVAGTGISGNAPNMLDHPDGIFVDTNFDLYVADCFNHRIQLFRSGEINGITVAGNGSVNITIILNNPSGIVLDADGYLFVADMSNHRIVGSNANGFQCIVGCSGSGGAGLNQLNSPRALSFDSDGNMYVTDSGNNRIQMFKLMTNLSAVTYTYSEIFTSGVIASAQCAAWTNFCALLPLRTYTTLRLSGSFDTTGVTVTTSSIVTAIASALRTSTAYGPIASNGRSWAVGLCGPGYELSTDGLVCNCAAGYVVRPCVNNSNWGGVNSASCNAPTQIMTVTFSY